MRQLRDSGISSENRSRLLRNVGLIAMLWNTMVMISHTIIKDWLSKSKVYPYGICSLCVKA